MIAPEFLSPLYRMAREGWPAQQANERNVLFRLQTASGILHEIFYSRFSCAPQKRPGTC
jgi:hypothetical protein